MPSQFYETTTGQALNADGLLWLLRRVGDLIPPINDLGVNVNLLTDSNTNSLEVVCIYDNQGDAKKVRDRMTELISPLFTQTEVLIVWSLTSRGTVAGSG